VISKDDPNPLDDDRVQNAIHLTLQGRDLADAERLMAEAGWPDGFGLRLLLSRFEKHGGSEAEAQMLREKLRRIGVRVEIY
jgi:ABC-type transport system substrate-binding protein